MNGRKRKLYQGLAYSDVQRKGIDYERVRAMHPPLHPKTEQAWGSFHRTYRDFEKIAAPGEHPSRFFMNREKRIKQLGPFHRTHGFPSPRPKKDRYPVYTPGILYR